MELKILIEGFLRGIDTLESAPHELAKRAGFYLLPIPIGLFLLIWLVK